MINKTNETIADIVREKDAEIARLRAVAAYKESEVK